MHFSTTGLLPEMRTALRQFNNSQPQDDKYMDPNHPYQYVPTIYTDQRTIYTQPPNPYEPPERPHPGPRPAAPAASVQPETAPVLTPPTAPKIWQRQHR